jgi:hypothetical protein
MSTSVFPSLDTRPFELIYRILDNLDGQWIILSLRHLSKRWDMVLDTYFHQVGYRLNFDRISKTDFDQVCRHIRPENVLSLILSDQSNTPGQIPLFLHLFSIKQFIRLRSLTLLNIEDRHLVLILKHAVACPLISVSIREADVTNLCSSFFNLRTAGSTKCDS